MPYGCKHERLRGTTNRLIAVYFVKLLELFEFLSLIDLSSQYFYDG